MFVARKMRLYHSIFTVLIGVASCYDGWEMYGGMKKKRRHGLNKAGIQDDEGDIILQGPESIHEAGEKAKRKKTKSIFDKLKKPEDYPLLPDRFSVLSFDQVDDFAIAGDVEEESKQEDMSFWGRLYIDGFPDLLGMQYFRAHFGFRPPSNIVRFTLATPFTMCDDDFRPVLNNTGRIDKDTIIVTKRGDCSFVEKAQVGLEAGAGGLLVINNEVSLYEIFMTFIDELESNLFLTMKLHSIGG